METRQQKCTEHACPHLLEWQCAGMCETKTPQNPDFVGFTIGERDLTMTTEWHRREINGKSFDFCRRSEDGKVRSISVREFGSHSRRHDVRFD
jgi:hypothetical protein